MGLMVMGGWIDGWIVCVVRVFVSVSFGFGFWINPKWRVDFGCFSEIGKSKPGLN